MNKKQLAIIVTLLVLIVCAGVLAAQLNNTLTISDSDISNGTSTISLNNTSKTTDTDYFTEAKLNREQQDNTTLDNLKAIKDDQDMTTDSRNSAATEYQRISVEKMNIINAETQIKALGFSDAICFNNDDKIKVVVKSSEKLNEKVVTQISAIIMDVFKTKDVAIEASK